jgi:oligopeptide/dipeptide ABC transporter ATP-binding protein
MNNILDIRNLKTYFFTREGVIKAADDISFVLKKGETLGIAGESGSGKSVTALSIIGLIQWPPGKIVGGEIYLDGKDLLKLSEKEMRNIRGNEISMIFQDPMTSLNPVFTIGKQIIETLILHQNLNKKDARERAISLLKEVGIPNPSRRIDQYPHEYSGGMRQRAMIAIALACKPKVLIADEPTTALDVTIQAQILEFMNKLKSEKNSSIIIITHDLGVIAEMADNIIIMYGGKIVEYGDTETIFYNSCHPYTWGLLKSIPSLDGEKAKLIPIKGNPPSLLKIPRGCSFSPRCSYAKDICFKETPKLKVAEGRHMVSCHLSQSEIRNIKMKQK